VKYKNVCNLLALEYLGDKVDFRKKLQKKFQLE
jgi:hypothetical protein